MRRLRKIILRCVLATIGAGLAAWAAFSGCISDRPLHVVLDPDVAIPDRCATILFVDGMDQPKTRELLARGALPHIREHFVDRGVEVENAIVSLPPTTYPNAVSLLTGRLPGHHGILGNQWYDRDTMLFCNYGTSESYRSVNEHFTAPTIYDLLPGELTVNVQCHTRRGVTYSIDNVNMSAIKWFLGWYEGYDRRTGLSIEEVAEIANREKRWPIVTMLYFPGLDEVGHACGVETERYAGALRTVDAQIGRVMSALERAGLRRRMYFALVTDHGHVQNSPQRTFELIRWLREQRGLRVRDLLSHDEDDVEPLERLERVDAVALDGAYRRAVIHVPGPGGWREQPTLEAVMKVVGGSDASSGPPLYECPGVGLLCVRGADASVLVFSPAGRAVIERRFAGGIAEYRVAAPANAPESPHVCDPLGYRRDPTLAAFVDAGWHTSRAWLTATATSRYPDFVPQIVEMFESPRAGDIVVFADEGWTFRHGEQGGHGSALWTDTRVSMFFSGPDVPHGAKLPCARLVDVMPTLMSLLGRAGRLEAAGALDGVDLSAAILAAGTAER